MCTTQFMMLRLYNMLDNYGCNANANLFPSSVWMRRETAKTFQNKSFVYVYFGLVN